MSTRPAADPTKKCQVVRLSSTSYLGDRRADPHVRTLTSTGSGQGWTEGGITYNNAPPISSTVLSSAGAVSSGQTVELDLVNLVTTNGTYSVAITSTNSDTVAYSGRQGTSPAELVITTGS